MRNEFFLLGGSAEIGHPVIAGPAPIPVVAGAEKGARERGANPRQAAGVSGRIERRALFPPGCPE
jgi:hypothetical protein